MASGIELTRHHARSETRIGGQHLVRGDHRESITEDDDDRVGNSRQLGWQHDVIGNRGATTLKIVVPVDAPQVARVGPLRIGIAHDRRIDRRGVGELSKCRQHDSLFAEALHAVGQGRGIHHAIGQAELILEGGLGGR